jgi:SAM-dependent methyltransferase
VLAERTGLADLVEYRQGDALEMPFTEESFDVVWSQNVVMNIAERDRLYGEIRRVLKPAGRYAFADVVAGNGGTPHFPLPWSPEASASFLLSAEETRVRLVAAGFLLAAFEDQTVDAISQQKARTDAAGSPSKLGIHILLGADGLTILKNSIRSFQEGRIGLVQGIARRVA